MLVGGEEWGGDTITAAHCVRLGFALDNTYVVGLAAVAQILAPFVNSLRARPILSNIAPCISLVACYLHLKNWLFFREINFL